LPYRRGSTVVKGIGGLLVEDEVEEKGQVREYVFNEE
jgi:hypothetical protein